MLYEFQDALYEAADGVATITLNRPQKLNAMSPRMEADMLEGLRLARGDDSVRVVVIAANGRGFCSGADVAAWDASIEAGERSPIRSWRGAGVAG